MIAASSKKPKYMSISIVKVADLLGEKPSVIEERLQELVTEGSLVKSKLTDPPYHEIYLLP
ncbi:hypothetical protein CVD19_14610 [Bacillus sp. T33-2]|nr:hypothetical protein CVD19_14610 [Bacillus sp. T33-2]